MSTKFSSFYKSAQKTYKKSMPIREGLIITFFLSETDFEFESDKISTIAMLVTYIHIYNR